LSGFAVGTVSRTRRRSAAAVLCVVALADFAAVPLPTYQPNPPAFYRELIEARRAAVLELPLGLHDGLGERGHIDPEALVFQTVHERPIFGGLVARIPPSVQRSYEEVPVLRALLQLSAGEPASELPSRETVAAFLHDSKTAYVVVSLKLAPAALQDFVVHGMPLTLRTTENGRALYVVQ